MSRKRAVADRKQSVSDAAPDTSTETPPPQLEGDGLLRWLRNARSVFLPTADQLAAVNLHGEDCIVRYPWLVAVVEDDATLASADVETVRTYFHKANPGAVYSDDGARLNGLHRELTERHGRPSARWGMGATIAACLNT